MKRDAVLAPVSWQRMIAAVEKVRARLLRAANALEQANVPWVDASTLGRLPTELRDRLPLIWQTPEG